ncbi:DnaB-like helicase N-terminal domain-containing protein [Streptomyces acidiscabies]|uniref:DnaB-like helicase N-terminal domain-containing protein n=2 Tax=Streptomyces acidiscabies TaxID=42234 RepID=A0AAP6BJ69_9ACTN|nr:DnaB-like helicase N-terminal domain-containing protein [Streptomyces acidiscabies]MBZ3916686.1 replicative DNA helicase [Streptomyces acidiscabies]MDX2965678.1 DnaB-like helicase N-terminal domain-containing protein [Streptomyces acidiscabies]MDX3024820.1 DnaB-like helicase N-terminal domain-containing protein [Streptomyces acidiscabies]MDX3795594.1 DnaB-like helicase N-terminal domain-containing protein [Streptomyces acidiscabies]
MNPTISPARPEDDDPGQVPAQRPAHYAGQALIGGLLLEPWRLPDTRPLHAEYLEHPVHQALFTAISTHPAPDPAQHATGTAWLNTVLADAQARTRGLDASLLHSLIQSCPHPAHVAAYARMVRDDHVRRRLRHHADRLTRAATDPTLSRPQDVFAQADTLHTALDELSGQITPHPGSLPRTPLPSTQRQAGEEELHDERLLLATATAQPYTVPQMRWLAADDFAHPLHAALWRCLTTLAHRGDMIDPVTVLGQAQYRGLITDTLPARALLDLLAVPDVSPEHLGEKVLHRAILTQTCTLAAHITAYADDPTTTPHQLVTGTRRSLAALTTLRTRWHTATTPAGPRTPTALSRSPRAGPRTAPPRPPHTPPLPRTPSPAPAARGT